MTTTLTTEPTKENLDKTYANRLAMFRQEHVHKSQTKAAKLLGMSQPNLSFIERAMTPINFQVISKLVTDFNLNLEWFTTGNGNPLTNASEKPQLVTDIKTLLAEMNSLKKYIRIMELNQTQLFNKIEELEKIIKKNGYPSDTK